MRKKMVKRLDYYDVIKGLAIFMVVVGHVVTMCIRDIDNAFIFKFIAQTHMPLFFFVSGYFTYKALAEGDGRMKEDFLQPSLLKRMRQLLIPALVMGALWYFYFPHSGLQSPMGTTVKDMLLSEWKNGYWFPPVLFLIIVVYYVFSILVGALRSNMTIYVTAALVWILLLLGANGMREDLCNLFSLKLVAEFYPIFILGVFARRHEKAFSRMLESEIVQTVALIVGALSLYVIIYRWEFSFMVEDMVAVIMPMYHACLVIITVALAKKFCAAYEDSKIKGCLTHLGQKSLEIYLLHYFFLFPMPFLQEPLRAMGLGITPIVAVAVPIAAVVVILVLGLNQVISLSPFLSSIMTGKINK